MGGRPQRVRLPPVTHVYVGNRLERLDAITLDEARSVITRLCDQLDDAESEIAWLKNGRRHA